MLHPLTVPRRPGGSGSVRVAPRLVVVAQNRHLGQRDSAGPRSCLGQTVDGNRCAISKVYQARASLYRVRWGLYLLTLFPQPSAVPDADPCPQLRKYRGAWRLCGQRCGPADLAAAGLPQVPRGSRPDEELLDIVESLEDSAALIPGARDLQVWVTSGWPAGVLRQLSVHDSRKVPRRRDKWKDQCLRPITHLIVDLY